MINLTKLPPLESIKTPSYFYDLSVLEKTLDELKSLERKFDFHIHYALKANSNNEILDLIQKKGFGADCVSGNEIKRALECGFDASKTVFAGVGKTDDEINIALENDILCFNCESIPEIEVINELASKQNKVAQIALRLNPNIDAYTHKYITTGLEENKFGINAYELDDIIELLKTLSHVKLIGLHFHIGSQIVDLKPYRELCSKVNEYIHFFEQKGFQLSIINVGGGLGINYNEPDSLNNPNFSAYFEIFNNFLECRPGQQLHFELGRSIVANCGSLISRVVYVKKGINTNFIILDAGMTELIRPALYQAFHKLENISSKENEMEVYDVVGPICESSDCFGKAINMPITKRGDIIAIRSTGAYGEVMASNYNLREKAPSIYYSAQS
jgi:diaminopimelate decarboxylase